MGVKDRIALITGAGGGAAGGIGVGLAQQLGRAGATIIVNDLTPEKVEATVSLLQLEGVKASGAVADITRKEQVDAMIDAAVAEYGRLDILVNNAGIAKDRSFLKLSEEDWDSVLDVNLKAQFLTCQAAVRHMRAQNYGRIVNISSRAWLGWIGQANYSASKGGVVSLSRSLAIELARFGITVNCIAPGLIDTPLLRSMPPETVEKLIKLQPTGTVGSPMDVGWAAVFFASDESHYITGQVLYTCGGKSLFASLSV